MKNKFPNVRTARHFLTLSVQFKFVVIFNQYTDGVYLKSVLLFFTQKQIYKI